MRQPLRFREGIHAWLAVVLSLVAALALSACSREAAPTPPGSAPASPSSPTSPPSEQSQKAPALRAEPTVQISPEERRTVQAQIEEARKLKGGERRDEALRTLTELSARALPADVAAAVLQARGEVLFARAMIQLEKDNDPLGAAATFSEAAKTLEDLIGRYPREERTPFGSYMLGSSYLMLEEWPKALRAYQSTFDGYPQYENRARALLRVGVCQAALGDVDRARSTFGRIVRAFPGESDDVRTARKHLNALQIVGQSAPPIGADSWLFSIASGGGIESFAGEVIVLVVFATWCENCGDELPHLRRLMRRWGAAGVTFLGVANPEDPQNKEPVDVYVQRNEIPFVDVALDRRWRSWSRYRVTALPAAAVIDRQGRVRWRGHPAFFPGPLLEKLVAAP